MKAYIKPDFFAESFDVEDIITASSATKVADILNGAIVENNGEEVNFQSTKMVDVSKLFANAQ